MFHILITCCFLFFSSECSLTQWEETEKVDKHESTTHQHCSWMENSFLNSFLEWIRDKIISLSPDQPRMAYEMSIPRNRFKNSIHIDVIVHKDFPLPSYAPGMQLSFFVRMCLNILYIDILFFQNLKMANRNLCVSRHPIQNGHVSIQFSSPSKKISNKNLCFIMFNIHFRFDRCRRQKCKGARTTFIKTGLGTFFKPIFLENSFAKNI